MGVPKFYRWLSERYPCLSEVVQDNQIPEFDNLYLDMNGIIHACSHPNDEDVSLRIPEEQVFYDIFHYIDTLFSIISPKKVFFLAVDGVAPRAKMNQQRARRFKSAKDAELLLMVAQRRGEDIPDEKRFDSNCITPGTKFMARLHEQLQYFIQMKISKDTAWQKIRVYLSGHNCPGEGEHKIMDFIRSERSRPDYDPNTRHCLYGLDADLIMLGMCSHEPHFSLLREEVTFGRPKQGDKSKKLGVDGIKFHLLHLSLLREYVACELRPPEKDLSFEYNFESVIDDWVMMSFLVGNDFIPHLPHVHIHEEALPILYSTYTQVLPQLDGYINVDGVLNLKRFQKFLKVFAKNDRRCFFEQLEDEAYLASKRKCKGTSSSNRKSNTTSAEEVEDLVRFDVEDLVRFEDSDMEETSSEELVPAEKVSKGAFDSESENEEKQEEIWDSFVAGKEPSPLQSASVLLSDENQSSATEDVQLPLGLIEDDSVENDCDRMWTPSINRAFKNHKRDYYSDKLKYQNISKEELKEQAKGYVRAIQWNLHYYYHGCCSWNWFYPHHYAPYISDVVDFSDMEMNFEMSKPFLPFEQLLAVLPAASAECLPVPYQELMIDDTSSIIQFYPRDFDTDLNGKKNDWEAVVLIPFINEELLLAAMATKEARLNEEERRRNSHGPHLLFTVDPSNPKVLKSTLPNVLSDVSNCIANVEEISMDYFRIPQERVVHGLLPGVKLDVYFPGFPTTKHIEYTTELMIANIRVFQMPSKKQSMIFKISKRIDLDEKDMLNVAFDFIGKEVHVHWPILKRGLVHEIWTPEKRYTKEEDTITCADLEEREKELYSNYLKETKKREFERFGIEVGEQNKAIALVRPLLGVEYRVHKKQIVIKRYWKCSSDAKPHSLALVVQNVIEEAGRDGRNYTIEEAYPVSSKAFIVSSVSKYYGQVATILENKILTQMNLVVSCTSPAVDFTPTDIIKNFRKLALSWFNVFEVSKRAMIDKSFVNRITGFIGLCPEDRSEAESGRRSMNKINIGFDLKSSKRNEAVPDFARRMKDGCWEYSFHTVRMLQQYREKFPEVFIRSEEISLDRDFYYACDIWPLLSNDDRQARIKELTNFLRSMPSYSIRRVSADGVFVDGNIVKELEKAAAKAVEMAGGKTVTKRLAVKPAALFMPELHAGNPTPDSSTEYFLLDRVVCVRKVLASPFGARGTVIGIIGSGPDQKIEVLFDEPFFGGNKIRGEQNSGCCVSPCALINVTHGERIRNEAPRGKNLMSHVRYHQDDIPRNEWRRSDLSKNIFENGFVPVASTSKAVSPRTRQNLPVPHKSVQILRREKPIVRKELSGQEDKRSTNSKEYGQPSTTESGYGKPPSHLLHSSDVKQTVLVQQTVEKEGDPGTSKEIGDDMEQLTAAQHIENMFSKLGLIKENNKSKNEKGIEIVTKMPFSLELLQPVVVHDTNMPSPSEPAGPSGLPLEKPCTDSTTGQITTPGATFPFAVKMDFSVPPPTLISPGIRGPMTINVRPPVRRRSRNRFGQGNCAIPAAVRAPRPTINYYQQRNCHSAITVPPPQPWNAARWEGPPSIPAFIPPPPSVIPLPLTSPRAPPIPPFVPIAQFQPMHPGSSSGRPPRSMTPTQVIRKKQCGNGRGKMETKEKLNSNIAIKTKEKTISKESVQNLESTLTTVSTSTVSNNGDEPKLPEKKTQVSYRARKSRRVAAKFN